MNMDEESRHLRAVEMMDGCEDIDSELLRQAEDDETVMRGIRDMMLMEDAVRSHDAPPDVEQRLAEFKARRREVAEAAIEDPTEAEARHRRSSIVWLWSVAAVAAAVIALFVMTRPKPTAMPADDAVAVVYRADKDSSRQVQISSATMRVADTPATEIPVEAETEPTDIGEVVEAHVVRVPKGGSYTLTLADGTKAYMHADSRLIHPVRFAGDTRTVQMEGEIYFDVAHDTRHPFVIKASRMTAVVRGTELNVRSYGDEADNVTLITGRVEVSTATSSRTLKPSEQSLVMADGTLQTSVVDTAPFTAWRDGFIYFDNMDLEDVMRCIGRDYNCTVEFRNKALLDYKVHFVAERDENVDSVLSTLNRMRMVRVLRQGNTIIVE